MACVLMTYGGFVIGKHDINIFVINYIYSVNNISTSFLYSLATEFVK